MKTIFLFLKNDLFISDLLKTEYIKYLSGKYRVVIFSSTISADQNQYFISPNITYVRWRVQNPKLFAWFKFLRTNCSHELDSLSSMKMYYRGQMFKSDKRARLARFLSWPLAPWLTLDRFTQAEYFLARTRLFSEYCRKYKPALIMTATPGIQVFDAEAIILAKKVGIPTLATNFSWDNLTAFKAVRLRKPDYIFVWNDIIRTSAIELHNFDPRRVWVTGSMRFDRYFNTTQVLPSRQDFLESKRLNPNYRTILFATVASNNCLFQSDIIKEIIKMRAKSVIPYVNVLIRLHPFDTPGVYREFLGMENICVELAGKKVSTLAGERVQIDGQDFLNLKSTLVHTDININYKSTISLESFLFDKPVVNFTDPTRPHQRGIYYDENSYYRPLVREGAVRVVTTSNELKEVINMYLANPNEDSANRKRVADIYLPFRDSQSYKRSVDFLEKII